MKLIFDPNKETVGKISQQLSLKTPESRDPIELERAMQEDYLKYLIECVENNKAKLSGDFFVEVTTKNEKLLPNVFRNYFSARKSCPTPNYDQSVYKYNRAAERIEYIWTIPNKETCYYLLKNKNLVVQEEQQLLGFVMQFAMGELFTLSKKLNKEQEDSPLLEI